MRLNFSLWARIGRAAILCIAAYVLATTSSAQTLVRGDVLVAAGGPAFEVYSDQGVYKGSIHKPAPSAGGYGACAFNNDFSKLYAGNWGTNSVDIYDATGTTHPLLKSIPFSTGAIGNSIDSVVFNEFGDWYAGFFYGYYPGVNVPESDPNDNLITTYAPPLSDIEYGAVAGIDLSSDQKTLFYSDNSSFVKRYDLSTRTLLPDFGSTGSEEVQAVRLLPPFDGTGGLLAPAVNAVYRFDGNGNPVQTYSLGFFQNSLALDPNGTSFWAFDTGRLELLNILSGAIEVGPITLRDGTGYASGLCVRGRTEGPDTTPPVVALSQTILGPPKKVLLASHDPQSGLAAVVVNSCVNCTAITNGFIPGTNSMVTTTATKTDQTKSSSIEITATDVDGNSTTFDPVDLTLESEGIPTVHRVRVKPSEHILVISNGRPGMSRLELRVNEQRLPTIDLVAGQQKTIDIAQYMLPKDKSEITISAEGKDHATAFLVFTER